MFWRLWLRSLTVKRPQAALAIGSVVVGAAVSSMLLNLYSDARRKMSQEFRAYGPNVVLSPGVSLGEGGNGAAVMDEAALARLKPLEQRESGLAAVAALYIAVRVKRLPADPRLPEFENVVAVGTDFNALRRMNPSWQLRGGPGERPAAGGASGGDGQTCVLGARVASRLRLGVGDSVELDLNGPSSRPPESARRSFRVSSVLSTGASEDDQVFVPLAMLQSLTGFNGKINLVELSIPGETVDVDRAIAGLVETFKGVSGLEVRPIRQIVYSSGKVLDTIRWLLISLTVLVLIIIAICIMATMTAIVLERRKDVAVMKALGASDRLLMELFLTEGAALGLLGGVAGFALGVELAREMAQRLFTVTLSVTWWTFPLVGSSSILLAMASSLLPLKIVPGIQPAAVLKGQ